MDIKKLDRFLRSGHRVTVARQQDSRGAGWEYVHVVINDHSRIAFGSTHDDESDCSPCAVRLRVLHYYRGLGIGFRGC